jgi:hypothetical protein
MKLIGSIRFRRNDTSSKYIPTHFKHSCKGNSYGGPFCATPRPIFRSPDGIALSSFQEHTGYLSTNKSPSNMLFLEQNKDNWLIIVIFITLSFPLTGISVVALRNSGVDKSLRSLSDLS